MNSALKASIRAVPEGTIYAVGGIVALAGAAIALVLVRIARLPFGIVVGCALVPFAAALLAWVVVAIARLRIVGWLPSDPEGLIPNALRPWIWAWLLIRFGLIGSGLLLIFAGVATAIAHGPLGRVVEAFVCVFWFRMFLDLTFGATFNAAVISTRR